MASWGIAELPLRVVKIVVCAPDCIRCLEARRALIRDEQHAVERLDALQIEDIAVAVGKQHRPGQPISIKAVGIVSGTSLSVHRANLKEAFEGYRRTDPRRPGTARRPELFVRGAHAFSAARVAHKADARESETAKPRAGWIIIQSRKLLQVSQHQTSPAEI